MGDLEFFWARCVGTVDITKYSLHPKKMEIVKGSAQSALNPSHFFDCYFCSRRWTINFGSWVFHPSFLRPYVIALIKNTGDPKNSVEVASLQFRRAPVSVVVQLGRFRSRPTRRWAMAAMTLCGVVPRYNRKPSRPQQWCWIEEILQLLEFFRRIVDAFWVMQDLLQQKYCDGRNLPKVAYGFKKIRRIQTMCFRPVGWDFVHKFRSGAKVNRSWIFTG